jgi:drug/metabolite transporter (DMT)-like permease
MAISLGDVHATKGQWLGILLVFGSTLTYAVYLTGVERWVPRLAPSRITAWAMTVSCLAVLLHSGLGGSFAKTLPAAAFGWGAIMAVVSTIAPSLLLSFGIRRIGAGPAAIASSLGPVSTILLANLFLHESLTWRQGVGAAFIISGVLLLGIRSGKGHEKVDPNAASKPIE